MDNDKSGRDSTVRLAPSPVRPAWHRPGAPELRLMMRPPSGAAGKRGRDRFWLNKSRRHRIQHEEDCVEDRLRDGGQPRGGAELRCRISLKVARQVSQKASSMLFK
ncbi:hypothetical protein HNR39_001777 [Glaciimonas immobilis]|uniref:Uncharacterized protein n=1 Tax=Glaciimonas immobilis TaxID=728004 RepID=A0A840RQB9_9BURK|nr:hypothetical protein [Glaciimonas immobilis]KAF3997087.1 hypothetical protein HAV38_15595 [Glaciimonas immobilis]MBB5199945.1 hypothetical protein [Glaciimonas immobilis]